MREIKFRAWDKEQKRMLVPAMPTLGGGMTWREGSYDSSSENYALMQFTGLKDKNGKEIYEGDIYTTDYLRSEIDRFEVKFDHAEFYGLGQNERNVALCGDGSEVQVIGNIYENPELLEVKRG